MSTRRRTFSGSPFEARVAYCRATRVGNFIAVSGTVAADENGHVVGAGDVHAQALFALRKIEKALVDLGASLRDVVRTRTFLTDMDRFDDFARAHAEIFATIAPAATAVEVRRLVAPEFLIEIEVDAIVVD